MIISAERAWDEGTKSWQLATVAEWHERHARNPDTTDLEKRRHRAIARLVRDVVDELRSWEIDALEAA